MLLQFEHIEYLFALAAIPLFVLLFLYLLKWKKSVSKKIGDPKFVSHLTRAYSPIRFNTKFVLVLVALVATILAAANLQMPGKGDNLTRKGVDIMMVLDVSKSTRAERSWQAQGSRSISITKVCDEPGDDAGCELAPGWGS